MCNAYLSTHFGNRVTKRELDTEIEECRMDVYFSNGEKAEKESACTFVHELNRKCGMTVPCY